MNTKKKKLSILTYPNPYLREVAQPVENFDEELKELFKEMCELMHESDGVGLAATQVGKSLQLLVLSSYVFLPPEERKAILDADGEMGEDMAVINPRVVEESKELIIDTEGCLSFPDVYIKVKRPAWVKIVAQNLEGEEYEIRGEGLGARAILHEMDHLTGKVMTDHLSFLARQKALKDHQKIQKHRARQADASGESSSVQKSTRSTLPSSSSKKFTKKKSAKKSKKRK